MATQSHPDADHPGPAVWQRPHTLAREFDRPHQFFLSGSVTSEIPAFRGLDVKGMLLWQEDLFHRRAPWVVGWVLAALGLQRIEHRGAWVRWLRELVRSTNDRFGVAMSFALVDSCRVPLRRRQVGIVERPVGLWPATRTGRMSDRGGCMVDGLPRMPTAVRFATRGDQRAGQLTRMSVKRDLVVAGDQLSECREAWFASTPDDDPLLANGYIPAGRNRIGNAGVNEGRIVTFGRIDPRSGCTREVSVDIDPVAGELISVRRQLAGTLRVLTTIDARMDGWLHEAVR